MKNVDALEKFQCKFCVNELKLYDTGVWTWSLRPDQPTLGSSIISLNRHAQCLSSINADEMGELAELIKVVEGTLKASFNYDILNYLMLMMVDNHVHYHVIPRYEIVRDFGGVLWVDNGWPQLPVISDCQYKDDKLMLNSIYNTLKDNP
ncbi:HIT family protein, partial [Vibrio sp. 10N.261.52.A1]|uniref:HIT family protein n=1 Tax=Vibrio sp. 10N.261.52.A1 TaxID=1880849 RepID=UPI000C851F5A